GQDDGVQVAAVEAGVGAAVAGGPDLVDAHQERVAVAVQGHGADPLDVAAGVALAPVLAAGAGPVGGAPGGQRAVQRLVVHPADHQHAMVGGVLHHGGEQSVRVALETGREVGVDAGGGNGGGGRGHS